MNAPVHPSALLNAQPVRASRRPQITIARGFDDLMKVVALRAAVYMADQDCPFHEEFDGNDMLSTHFIASINGEPAGCLRARFFHDFVKLERLAVLRKFRRSTAAFDLVRAGIDLSRQKGFPRIYGHAREGLERFWARFGAKPFADNRQIRFSDCRYTEMVIELEPHHDPITMESGGLVIIRPEGEWHRPGVLDRSAQRGAIFRSDNAL